MSSDADAMDKTRQTQLMRACRKDAMEDARSLLEQKASVNICSWVGKQAETALTVALLQSSTDLVKLLLENRAAPNLELGRCGHQPLTLAAQRGDVDKIKLLLEAKALIDESPRVKGSRQRHSALSEASRAGRPAAVNCLLKCNAWIGFRDHQGLNALMHAVSMCPSRDPFRYVEVADMLLKAGLSACDLSVKGEGIPAGRSVLMMACKSADVSMVRLLLANSASAEINVTDSSGASALTLSIWRGCPETVQLLLENHADANRVNQKGESAACYAQKMQSSQQIRNLVGCVAAPDPPSRKGELLDKAENRRRPANAVDSVARNEKKMKMADPSTDTDQQNGEVDLSALHQTGGSNWIFHQGQLINLEDEADTAGLSENDFAMLLAEACAKNERPSPALEKVPLQSWELDKMLQIAEQTMAAVESGRYTPQYGEVLLTSLRGWPGDVHWLQSEVKRMEELLTGKDHMSLQALRQEINDSLVSTLREVQKNLQSAILDPPRNCRRAAAEAGPLSMAVCSACHGSGKLLEEACPLCEGDPSFASETSSSSGCDHACDVVSQRGGFRKIRCCHCAYRQLHIEIFEGMKEWWHRRSMETPDIEQPDRWRFFCGACSRRWSAKEQSAGFSRADTQQSLSMPVPFGGCVLCVAGTATNAEEVHPSCIRRQGSNAHSSTEPHDASSEAGSWTLVLDSDDGGWAIVDVCDTST